MIITSGLLWMKVCFENWLNTSNRKLNSLRSRKWKQSQKVKIQIQYHYFPVLVSPSLKSSQLINLTYSRSVWRRMGMVTSCSMINILLKCTFPRFLVKNFLKKHKNTCHLKKRRSILKSSINMLNPHQCLILYSWILCTKF